MHVLEVDVGPAVALRLGRAGSSPERWEARLVERDAAGRDRAWSWRRLVPGELPLLRYPTREFAPDPAWHARVEVRLVEGDWFGRAPVRSTAGVAPLEVPVRLVQYAAFGGLVQDAAGRAVVGARVRVRQESGDALPLYAAPWREQVTDADGSFAFDQQLEPGQYHLRLLSEGRAPVDLDVALEEGGLEGYVLEVREVDATHALVGEVRPHGAAAPALILGLRSADGSVERVLHPLQDPARARASGAVVTSDGALRFRFEALPAGRYELVLFALDGLPYAPSAQTVEVPGDPLVIAAVAAGTPEVFAFDVRGAEGGPPIEHYHALFRAPGWWTPGAHGLAPGQPVAALAPDAPVTWMAWAHGYRPAYGDAGAFAPDEAGGPRRAALVLEPGWGAELYLREAGPAGAPDDADAYEQIALARLRPPVPGVEVWADGALAGTSDAAGLVRLSLAAKPARLELRKPGWRALDTATFADGVLVETPPEEQRCAVLWMEGR
ncbi:MAG: hypothetical protein H6828_09315 [Planctomycetes bacterium]|nr:hypothetical protein [Planctomycetota bacterium]